MKICIVTGSEGTNLDLANKFAECLKKKNVQVSILDIVKMNLPLYTTAAEATVSATELMAPYTQDLSSQGFVFLAPEYNGATPPAFTNFLSWLSRSTKSWREHFNNRVVAIGSSNGGGTNVFTVMRIQLAHLGMNVMGRHVHVTSQKPLYEKTLEIVCEQLVNLAASAKA